MPNGHAAAADPRGGAPVRVDRDARRAWLGDRELNLTRREFNILATLTAQPGTAFTRATIFREAWSPDWYGTTRTIDQHVMHLRRELGAHADYITTIRGVGYRWDGPLTAPPPTIEAVLDRVTAELAAALAAEALQEAQGLRTQVRDANGSGQPSSRRSCSAGVEDEKAVARMSVSYSVPVEVSPGGGAADPLASAFFCAASARRLRSSRTSRDT